jgi:hypothetical protein
MRTRSKKRPLDERGFACGSWSGNAADGLELLQSERDRIQFSAISLELLRACCAACLDGSYGLYMLVSQSRTDGRQTEISLEPYAKTCSFRNHL